MFGEGIRQSFFDYLMNALEMTITFEKISPKTYK